MPEIAVPELVNGVADELGSGVLFERGVVSVEDGMGGFVLCANDGDG